MKLTIILSTKHAETNWNALRLANLAIQKGDAVSLFLTGDGVEYDRNGSPQFNIKGQIDKFRKSKKGSLRACETCMNQRQQKDSQECPAGGIEDLYNLIAESDKVITF